MSIARSLVAASLLWISAATLGMAQENPDGSARPSHRVLGADRGHVAIVNARGDVEWEVPVRGTPHDLARLANGNILFPSDAATVVEMTPAKDVVWSYTSKPKEGYKGPVEVHAFQRLPDGNTLIAAGSGNRVIEVNPEGKVVWSIGHDELPGIRLFWVTTLQLLPDGHLVVGNCHAGPDNPQLFEVTRDKRVVWTFKD